MFDYAPFDRDSDHLEMIFISETARKAEMQCWWVSYSVVNKFTSVRMALTALGNGGPSLEMTYQTGHHETVVCSRCCDLLLISWGNEKTIEC